MRPLLLAALLLVGAAGAEDSEDRKEEEAPQEHTFEAPRLAGSVLLPKHWSADIAPDKSGTTWPDSIRKQMEAAEEARRLPNDAFEFEERWCNSGDVLAKVRLRVGRKEFKGTAQQLADLCIAEIREKWPAFKGAKPAIKPMALRTGPALYVSFKRQKELPYLVHFVVLVVEGKGCGLFCYGWGPQVNVVNLGQNPLPASARRVAEEAAKLSPERRKAQDALFKEFETVIVPSLHLAKAEAKPEAKPERGADAGK